MNHVAAMAFIISFWFGFHLWAIGAFEQVYAFFYFRGPNMRFPLRVNGFPFFRFYLWAVATLTWVTLLILDLTGVV